MAMQAGRCSTRATITFDLPLNTLISHRMTRRRHCTFNLGSEAEAKAKGRSYDRLKGLANLTAMTVVLHSHLVVPGVGVLKHAPVHCILELIQQRTLIHTCRTEARRAQQLQPSLSLDLYPRPRSRPQQKPDSRDNQHTSSVSWNTPSSGLPSRLNVLAKTKLPTVTEYGA